MNRSEIVVAFVALALSVCLITVQGCNLPTPIIKAYDDGFIRFTIPAAPSEVKTYGIKYEILNNQDERLDGGSSSYGLMEPREHKFGLRILERPSPLGQKVKYVMFEGEWKTKTCATEPKTYEITALLRSEDYEN